MRLCCLLVCLLFGGSTLTGCGSAADGEGSTKVVLTTGFAEDEVFRIGSSSCKLAEIMVYLTNMQNQYESVYGTQIWERKIGEITLEDKVKNVVLARIAQIKTMNLLALQRGVTLSEQEEASVKSAAEEYFTSLNEAEKTQMNITQEDIEQLYQEYALANKVYDLIIQDTNPEISDDEARTVTVSQILIKTYALDGEGGRSEYTEASKEGAYEKAKNIQKKLKDGEDFDALAGRYNEDGLFTISFGKGEKETAYEEAAFNLGNDEISDVIETKDGYYILKCISTFDRAQTDANKEKIIKQRKEEAFTEIYDEFLKTQIRNMNDALWEQVAFLHDEQIRTSSFFDIYNAYFDN